MPATNAQLTFGSGAQFSGAAEVSDRHFGTVTTSGFAWAGVGGPVDSYAERYYPDPLAGEFQVGSRLDYALDAIGATSLRYPGGTEAWSSFKWRSTEQNPDSTGLSSIEKLHRVIDYCATKGLGLDFTFPVRGFDPYAGDDAEQAKHFIEVELLEYAADKGVAVHSIKVGNEYNVGQGGGHQVAAEDFAEVTNAIIRAIGPTIEAFSQSPSAGEDWVEPDLLIESGVLWRYGAADIGFDAEGGGSAGNNDVQDTFDFYAGIDSIAGGYIDGIDLHNLTLDLGFSDYLGLEPQGIDREWLAQEDLLSYMVARWESYEATAQKLNDLEFHALAWSYPRSSDQIIDTVTSPIMSILQLHSMAAAGVDSASSWLATGFVNNALVSPAVVGQPPEEAQVSSAGKALQHMSTFLPGMRPIALDLLGSSDEIISLGYSNNEDIVLYLMNPGKTAVSLNLDLHDILGAISAEHPHSIQITDLSSEESDAYDLIVLQPGVSDEAEEFYLSVAGVGAVAIQLSIHDDTYFSGDALSVPFSSEMVEEIRLHQSYSEMYFGDSLFRIDDISRVHFADISYSLPDLLTVVDVIDQRETVGRRLQGTAEADVLVGTDYADVLFGSLGSDTLIGGKGNDTYWVDEIGDHVEESTGYEEGGGIDTIWASITYTLPPNTEILRLLPTSPEQRLDGIGNDAPGTLVGNEGHNKLIGRGGNDQLNGNIGDDILVGGVGRDVLVGGEGADSFVFLSISESRSGTSQRDVLNGFQRGQDIIDLSGIDADTTSFGKDDAFEFIGFADFSSNDEGAAGQLRLQSLGGPNAVLVEADHNGDGVPDFQILALGTMILGAEDFIL